MKPLRHNKFAAANLLALAALLLASAVALGQSTSPSLPPREIAAASGADADWLVRPAVLQDGKPRWTVLKRTRPSRDRLWNAIATLNIRPTSIAPFGERLAVVLEDGSWTIVSPGYQAIGPTPPAGFALESVQSAPDGLAFIVRQANVDGPRFLKFDGRGFSELQGADLKDSALPALLRTKPQGTLDSATSSDGKLVADRTPTGVHLLNLLSGKEATVVLADAATSQRLTLSRDEDGSARFWWLDEGRLLSQSFSLDSAKAKGEPEAAVIRPPPEPPMFERALYVLGALALVLVLFSGGRQTIAAARTLVAKVPPRPAPLARRLAAGIIDALPLGACVIYLAVGGKLTIFAGLLQFDSPQSQAILAAGVLFYLVLLIAFEVQWQQSIGKKIFALRVVALDGSKPRAMAVLVRNLLRLVDLNLVTLLFVPVTPLRQRLGDFLAGTMVIDELDADAPATHHVTTGDQTDNSNDRH